MTAEIELPPADAHARRAPPSRLWPAVDRLLTRWGDRLNPILVKETRQALKSRQFSITFGLLLLCAWVWTIFGVSDIGPDVFYGAYGARMFYGYYVILALPLAVIVPFGAFRSLAGEKEDRTYELLSISTLTPQQIVRGKLGSAALQMMIYLSALSPCLAFTYLLRGIDLLSIAFIVGYSVLGCLGLSMIAILAGTTVVEKYWQVLLSVVLIGGLFAAFGGAVDLIDELLNRGNLSSDFSQPEFWQGCAAALTAYVSYFMLVFYMAAAQLTFAADNRATRLRIIMVAQHTLFAGWMAWVWVSVAHGEPEVLLWFMLGCGLHWYVMGAAMTGESPELSLRVKRNLPQSLLGRGLLTWFNPGPGTGYLLAITAMVAALAMVGIAVACRAHVAPAMVLPPAGSAVMTPGGLATVQPDGSLQTVPPGATVAIPPGGPVMLWTLATWPPGMTTLLFRVGILGISYAVIYLGAGLLVMRLFRRFANVGVPLAVLVQILLLLTGVFVPTVIQAFSPELRRMDYTLLHAYNPFSLAYVIHSGFVGLRLVGTSNATIQTLTTIVPVTAALVFLFCLPNVVREVRQVRIAKPRRVAEEDAEKAAAKAPLGPVRRSPWDD